jgi:dUTP pyrophosphatase
LPNSLNGVIAIIIRAPTMVEKIAVSANGANAVESASKKLALDASADQVNLRVKKLHPDAKLPKRCSQLAAGYDVSAIEDIVVPAKGRCIVGTGIAIAIPEGHYGRLAPRSGLARDHGVDVGGGVVDCDYRGEVKVILFNFGDADYCISKGDRICQLVIERIGTPDVVECSALEDTDRGAKGFSSTGLH